VRPNTLKEAKVELDKERIDDVFAAHDHQTDVFLELYRLVYNGSAEDRPEWDSIGAIVRWPKMGPEISQYIWRKFMDFDRKHHPEVLAGGFWMNRGWSTDETLDDWQVEPVSATLISGEL